MNSFHTVSDRVQAVRRRIAAAARRSGRTADSVTLVCVSKYASPEQTAAAVRSGIADIGENYAQHAQRKYESLRQLLPPEEFASLRLHMIGHLQTNKAAKITPIAALIQSVDSDRLARVLSDIGLAGQRTIPVLAEVNISRESRKYGLSPEQTPETLRRWDADFPGITLNGLMAMAPFSDTAEHSRPFFRAMADLLARINADRSRSGRPVLPELSLGMSSDFEVGIEEGATIVRVGSAIFS